MFINAAHLFIFLGCIYTFLKMCIYAKHAHMLHKYFSYKMHIFFKKGRLCCMCKCAPMPHNLKKQLGCSVAHASLHQCRTIVLLWERGFFPKKRCVYTTCARAHATYFFGNTFYFENMGHATHLKKKREQII